MREARIKLGGFVLDLFFDQKPHHAFEQAISAGRPGHGDIGNDAHTLFTHGLHQLHDSVAAGTERIDAGAISLRFGHARGANGVGLAQRPEPRRLGFT